MVEDVVKIKTLDADTKSVIFAVSYASCVDIIAERKFFNAVVGTRFSVKKVDANLRTV